MRPTSSLLLWQCHWFWRIKFYGSVHTVLSVVNKGMSRFSLLYHTHTHTHTQRIHWSREEIRLCPCCRLPEVWVNEPSSAGNVLVFRGFVLFLFWKAIFELKYLHVRVSLWHTFPNERPSMTFGLCLMGGRIPLLLLINHTEMMWGIFFTQLYSMSPWLVSTANQTKSSSVRPSVTKPFSHQIYRRLNQTFTMIQIRDKWNERFFVSGSHRV